MKIVRSITECRSTASGMISLGFVPTMGALHAGHISLLNEARKHANHVAVSIFVNPTQFGPGEDYSRYPRPIERDLDLCRDARADIVFIPGAEEMYPPNVPKASIDVPELTGVLEGAHRPSHFAGVCTVVAKLLNIVSPQVACFGEKDFQQLAVIKAMVRALDMPCKIIGCPTLRDADGLAMSSRNQYLSPAERARGLSISRALCAAHDAVEAGETDGSKLRSVLRSILLENSTSTPVQVDLQYATVIDPTTLAELDVVTGEARAVVAMKVGNTRLIDNMQLSRPST